MGSVLMMEKVDVIEELRLRRWARQNYVHPEDRDETWHPIVHEEMELKDVEEQDPVPIAVAARTER